MTSPTSWYLTRTVTWVKHRKTGAQDPTYGNDLFTDTQVQVTNCLWDPKPVTSVMYAGKMEITDREEHLTDFGTLYIQDPNIDAETTDQVILDAGAPFQCVGPIERHTGSRTGIDYASVNLKRVTG